MTTINCLRFISEISALLTWFEMLYLLTGKINFQIWTRDRGMGPYHNDKIAPDMLFTGHKSFFLQLDLKSKKSIFSNVSDLNFARIEFQLAIDRFK